MSARASCAGARSTRCSAPPACPSPSAACLPASPRAKPRVLIHLARGATNKEIASSLGIAVRTANHHIENIYAKLDVTTRAAAAVFAVRHDLVASDGEHRASGDERRRAATSGDERPTSGDERRRAATSGDERRRAATSGPEQRRAATAYVTVSGKLRRWVILPMELLNAPA